MKLMDIFGTKGKNQVTSELPVAIVDVSKALRDISELFAQLAVITYPRIATVLAEQGDSVRGVTFNNYTTHDRVAPDPFGCLSLKVLRDTEKEEIVFAVFVAIQDGKLTVRKDYQDSVEFKGLTDEFEEHIAKFELLYK